MRVLFDSHALYWWLRDDPRLPEKARVAIGSPETDALISPVNIYELAYKAGRGRLLLPSDRGSLRQQISEAGFVELPITAAHAEQAALLSLDHRDPFDRLLIAQAMIEDLLLVSNEQLFDTTGVRRLWK